jgi:hypothetical protein
LDDVLVDGERFAFDEDVWVEEVCRFREAGAARSAATGARAQIERPGAQVPLRGCEEHGPDGTRLVACAKVYVPIGLSVSEAPYGLVFAIRADCESGMLTLRLIAFGERHPSTGRSVYERAHMRLHGRYPDQE